jgi:hypothetical protein
MAIPNMHEERLVMLMDAYVAALRAHGLLREISGVIGGDDSARCSSTANEMSWPQRAEETAGRRQRPALAFAARVALLGRDIRRSMVRHI